MVLLYVYILLIILNLIKRDSKVLFFSLIIFMWILVGWSEGTADWHIYVARFENYEEVSSRTEVVFTLIMRIGHFLNFDYRMMYVVLTAVCFLLIGSTIYAYSKAPGFVIAIYAIFTFPIDATQLRFFTAFSVAVFAYRFIFNYYCTKKKKEIIKWLLAMLVAVNIHMSVLVFTVVLIPLFFSRKTTIIFTIVSNALMVFFSSTRSRVYEMIVSLLGSEKADIVAEQRAQYGMGTIIFVWIKILIIFLGFVLFYVFIKYFTQRNHLHELGNCLSDGKYQIINYEKCLDFNIAILSIMGLIMVTSDFYRIQQIVMMLNYMIYASYLTPSKKQTLVVNNLVIVILSVSFAFIALYNLVLNSMNYNTVFLPLFQNNQLLNNIL